MNSTDTSITDGLFGASLRKTAHGLAAAGLLAALVGCGTTQPSLPTVDDTQRRPVNSAAALELLTCRAEAQALRLNLMESPSSAALGAGGARSATCSGVTAPAPATKPEHSKTSVGSSRAVFEFEVGKAELALDDAALLVLRRAAQSADVILVHAAGSGAAGSTDHLSTARDQAEATGRALVQAGIDPHKLRITWAAAQPAQGQPDRSTRSMGVVEVEFVERATRLLFSRPAMQPVETNSDQQEKPAVARLHADGGRH